MSTAPYIYIGADHGGCELKEALSPWLETEGFSVTDVGAAQLNPNDDYPEFALAVVQKLQEQAELAIEDPRTFGILVCRTGAGMQMVANKFQGIRAATCHTQDEVRLSRAHNNANILVLEGDVITTDEAQQFIKLFVQTPFDGGRHQRRVEQFAQFGQTSVPQQ